VKPGDKRIDDAHMQKNDEGNRYKMPGRISLSLREVHPNFL
jgi:hypothetical protein